jgi:hypothetical protein
MTTTSTATRGSFSRRALLARLGIGLGWLPLLSASRARGAASPPKRLVCVVQPFGYRTGAWLPPVGPLGTAPLPDSVAPLEPHRSELIFLGELTNPAFAGCPGCGAGAYGSILTAGPARGASAEFPEPTTASVDQVVGDAIVRTGAVSMRALALGVQVDAGLAAPAAVARCCWRDRSVPVYPEQNPYKVFERLFAGGPGDGQAARRLILEKRSMLDYVGRELERYGRRLGTEDRASLAAHVDGVRGIERALGPVLGPAASCAPALGPRLDPWRPASFPQMLDLQMRLMVAALRCDATRVATLQIANGRGSDLALDFVPGVPRGTSSPPATWETLARAQPPADGSPDPKRLIDKWLMGALARLLDQMKAVPEADTTLLGNSVVLWATPMEDGATGNAQRVPWLLAGSCQRTFKTGQVVATAGKPINGVLSELCNAMDVPVTSFGDPTHGGPLPGLRG